MVAKPAREVPAMRDDARVRAGLIDEFAATGIAKVEGAFGADSAARMRDVIWRELLYRYEVERDDPATWYRHAPTGLTTAKKSPAFAPICSRAVGEVLDVLLGAGSWQPPKQYGNVLVTMPDTDAWRVPHRIWHADFPPTLATDRLPAVKLWALLDDIEPGGGGTPQLEGSHVAFARYLATNPETDYKRAKFGFLASHPWLRALTRDDGDPGRNARFMQQSTEVHGAALRVVECAGQAGDVYVTHPWVFHSIAKNASTRPRLMRSVAIRGIDTPSSRPSSRDGREVRDPSSPELVDVRVGTDDRPEERRHEASCREALRLDRMGVRADPVERVAHVAVHEQQLHQTLRTAGLAPEVHRNVARIVLSRGWGP
jgi:hypothetical protein